MRNWNSFDPRQRLAAAVGWAVFVVVAIASLVAADLAARAAERRSQADMQGLVRQFAIQMGHGLATSLRTRLSIVRTTASQIVASDDRGGERLRRHLEAVQAEFPEFAWFAVIDDSGRVIAGTGGLREGETVAQAQWFRQGLRAPYVGDVRVDAPLAQRLGTRSAQRDADRFIDAAAPIRNSEGRVVGVAAAQLRWDWLEAQQQQLIAGLDTVRQPQLLLLQRDGTVLLGPPGWRGRRATGADFTEGGRYLVADHGATGEGVEPLPWRVVMRVSAAAALESAHHTRRLVFGTVAGAGLLAALVAVLAAHLLMRRLTALAAQAEDIRRGRRQALDRPAGADEVARIGGAMAALVEHLQHEKAALAQLNAELDARVAERSARIERLADENRRAAVTRERLRIARDLHDTLAHSLMALLTQIRVMRKLRPKLTADELDHELAQAEEVTADGLARSRAAITQMRHNGVRDAGLGPALHELLQRLAERTGLATELLVDEDVAALVDERAETVFRIVEEAVHNVERHAHARTVKIELRQMLQGDARRLRVSVVDDGVGFDPGVPVPGHYGVLGMREQAALIHAELRVLSRPGEGTRVELELDA